MIPCPYCAHQGSKKPAFPLDGKDALTVKPNTIRYGCNQGHKFARELSVPKRA